MADQERKLSVRQKKFIEEMKTAKNATEAARKAGYAEKTAYKEADRLLKNPRVAAAIAQNQQKISEKFNITQEAIVQELAMVGFGNLANVVDGNGNIDVNQSGFISSISKSESSGDQGSSSSFSVATHNKVKALELLGKHIGMWKNAQPGTDTGNRKALLDRVSVLLRKRRERESGGSS